MQTLQKLIESRAAKRLNNDLDKIIKFAEGNRLLICAMDGLPDLSFNPKEGKEVVTQSMGQHLTRPYTWGRSYLGALREAWLSTYIQEESKVFLREFDELKVQFAELQQQVDHTQID